MGQWGLCSQTSGECSGDLENSLNSNANEELFGNDCLEC